MKRQNIRTLSLVVITLTYLIIGAAVFDHFESENEKHLNDKLLHNITVFRKKYNMNESEFNRLWLKLLEKKPYQAGNQWKFVGSLYFCTVVVTLIGYGHSTPRTTAGKCFCIVYTFVGVPIFLIMFQSVGERLNSLIVFFLTRFKKRLKLKNQEVGLFDLITIEFFLTMTITLVASYVFMTNEEWTYFDAMYYCFITLTTIGFGDFVPLQKNNFLSNNFTYACFTILFILIGLTTLASSMNLLVLRLATINAEEQVQERLEQAEAKRQAVHLEGDVITPNARLFNTTEKPEQLETISVCSCACLDYKIWHSRRKKPRKIKLKHDKDESFNNNSFIGDNNNINTPNIIAKTNNDQNNNKNDDDDILDEDNDDDYELSMNDNFGIMSRRHTSNDPQNGGTRKLSNNKLLTFLMARRSLPVKRLFGRKLSNKRSVLVNASGAAAANEFEMMTTSFTTTQSAARKPIDPSRTTTLTGSSKIVNLKSTSFYSNSSKRNSI